MLRITLYKNCILNETYQNVISVGKVSGQSILDKYLATLSPLQISDIKDAYYRNDGILNFDLELINGLNTNLIYEFNYMKILYYDDEEIPTLKLKRYCFIQDIQVFNDIVQIRYSEDIFSSYSGSITKLTESYLSRSRVLQYKNKTISLHELPINYNGNEKLTLNTVQNQTFNILVTLQYYNASVFGNATERHYESFLLEFQKSGYGNDDYRTYDFTLLQLNELFSSLIMTQSRNVFGLNDDYYQVGDIYILPSSYMQKTYYDIKSPLFPNLTTIKVISDIPNNKSINIYCWPMKIANKFIKNNLTSEITVNNDFKNLSIGTFNTQIPIINNGTKFKYQLYLQVDDANIKIYINLLNQLIDISDDFNFEVPFSSLLGEENISRKTQRVFKNIENIMSVSFGITSGGMGISSNLDKIEGLNETISKLAFTKTRKPTTSAKKLKAINRAQQSILNLKEEDIQSELGIAKNTGNGIIDLIENNLPIYTSNKGTFAKSSGILNALYGIFINKINSDNDTYVLKTINNTGYVVYEYCNDLDDIDFNKPSETTFTNINYDVIKFDTINVIGSFPRIIALQLNDIFMNGFKIWYNESLLDDNLGVR